MTVVMTLNVKVAKFVTKPQLDTSVYFKLATSQVSVKTGILVFISAVSNKEKCATLTWTAIMINGVSTTYVSSCTAHCLTTICASPMVYARITTAHLAASNTVPEKLIVTTGQVNAEKPTTL